jgi:hypothetical protein
MKNIIQSLIFSKKPIRFIILAIILINFGIFGKPRSFILQNEPTRPRAVIVTLIRSTNQSILLVINIIHSVVKFHSINRTYVYPLLIFHDQNFTSSMRQQILSCTIKSNKQIQISCAIVDFQTSIKPSKGSQADKKIGYHLMREGKSGSW